MERYRRATVFLLIASFFTTSLVLFTDLPLLAPDLRVLYAVTKLMITVSILGVAYWLHRDVTSQNANTAAGVLLIAYCCHGQLFRPTYYFALIQVLTAFSFAFPISKIRFRIITIVGCICFAIVACLTWDHFKAIGAAPTLSDILQVILVCLIAALACNTFFSSERTIRDEYTQRFAQIGIQTARTVHDLKGLISAPKLYVQILENKYAENIHPEAVEILSLLSRDLESLQVVLRELNQLSVTNLIETEFIKVADVAISLQLLLHKKLGGVDLRCTTEMQIRYSRAALTSVLLNLVMNSTTAFGEKSPKDRFIKIDSFQNSLIISDNAGGFDAQVLKDLRRKIFVPRQSESGMGLLFVTDEMHKVGGEVQFENTSDGSKISLIFPAKLVRH